MSKPIKLTAELLRKITEEFVASVKSMKMFDGKLSYTKNFKWETNGEDKVTIIFSTAAFAKMTVLVHNFDGEVAWHGVVYRDENVQNRFYITDILVYPQEVTGSTVNTDQSGYTNWLYSLDDDVFNNLRMQGHSHVNFSTTPSPVDTTHQEKILAQVDDDMFYIFMIWNKKFERFIKIYDMKNNTLYETEDCTVLIGEDGLDLDAFLADARKVVVKKAYQPAARQNAAGTPTSPNKVVGVVTSGQQKTKIKEKKPGTGRGGNYFDDDDDNGYGYGYGYGSGYYRYD